MFSNYLKTAIRSLLKNKIISMINIVGLAIGLASFMLILSYTNHEISFDRFHANADRIYRCVITMRSDHGIESCPQMVAAVGPALKEEFPEIEKMVRFRERERKYLEFNKKGFYVSDVLYADSTLFEVFSFRLLQGNPMNALANPYSIVLSVKTAERIFGTEDPIGKMITLENKDLLTVTGIIEDAPTNSHIQYNAFISFSSLYHDKNMYLDWNGGNAYYTYFLAKPNTNILQLADRFPAFMDKHLNSAFFTGTSWSAEMFLQPLQRIYLHSDLPGEIGPTGNLTYLLLFIFAALIIFVIACINFINLTSARLTTRLRETSVRKILGASPSKILLQFLTESIIMNLTALLFAFIIAESLLPLINSILGQNLVLYEALGFRFTPGILFFIIITGTLAGCYPALYLTTLTVSNTYGKTNPVKSSGIRVRKVTVLLQYTLSITMIICTLLLYKQLYFIRHKDPGFDRKNILVIPLSAQYISNMHGLLKEDFLSISQVEKVAVSSDYPGRGFTKNGYVSEGSSDAALINVIDGDEDLLDVLGLKIIKGRNFMGSFATDESAYLINESYAHSLNWTNPEGKFIYRNGRHEVIGVVKDFNFAPFREKIAPLIFTRFSEGGRNYILVKVKSGQMKAAVTQLNRKWESRLKEVPFDYFLLDNATREVYESERSLSDVILLFTILAIFIAFLGLFGLSLFETERQTKNIGIRKVNGANSLEIVMMLTREFTRLVFLSFILACPIAYYFITRWLQQFAYKTGVSWWIFLASLIIITAIALITVICQSNRAANRDPVEALRYE
jgi:putative ABC transport system permease protein